MHQLESVLENQTNKILCNFETQMDHPILARRKKNLSFNGFCHSSRSQSLNERKQKDRQILGSCHWVEKTV